MRGQLRAHKENARREIITLQLRDFPSRLARRELRIVIPFRLEHETAAPGQLRDGRVGADAPDQRFEAVAARRKPQVIGRVGPVLNVGPVGAPGDAMAVQKQLKAFVSADVNAHGRGGGLKLLAKAQQDRLTPPAGKNIRMRRGRSVSEFRMPDPRGLVDGLNRDNPGVSNVQARRQKDFVDDW